MAEVTSALTTKDLVLEVARTAEIAHWGSTGAEEAMIPTDTADLSRCLTVVNNAIRHFIATAPPGGWNWRNRWMDVDLVFSYEGTADAADATSITDTDIAGTYDDDYFNGYVLTITAGTGLDEYATVTDYDGTLGKFTFAALSGGTTPDTTSEYRICRSTQVINSDPTRYLLDQSFQGQYTGPITYAAEQNALGIEWVDEATIRRYREVDVYQTDAPFVAAVRPYSTQRRWELIVDPEPTENNTITFPYKASFDQLQIVSGEASAGDATSITDSSIANLYPDDYFNGWTVYVMSGTGKNSYAVVTDYTGSTGAFTVADWLATDGSAGGTDPDATSEYYVMPADDRHPAGLSFDQAILSACRAHTEQEFADIDRGYWDKYMNMDLPAAYRIDFRGRPKKLGVMRSGSGPRLRYIQRPIVEYEQ